MGQATAPNTTVVFRNFDSPEQTFSFLDNVSVVPAFTAVASTGTAVPGGSGVFTAFPQSPALSAPITAFLGLGSAGEFGVYSRAIPGNPVQPIADLTTAIPGGTGTFTGSTQLAASGTLTSFIGTGSGQAGVYSWDSAIPVEPIQPIADLTTAIPGGTLRKVVAVGDTLGGKVITALRFGQAGLDGSTLSFGATFADGSQGVFTVDVQVLPYHFSGFFQPVANVPVFNRVKPGQAVPVKFSLQGNQGLAIFAPGYPSRSEQIACNSKALVSGTEQTVTAGASSLSYDAATDRYTYVWKTDNTWADTCRQLMLELKDGSFHRANFTFK